MNAKNASIITCLVVALHALMEFLIKNVNIIKKEDVTFAVIQESMNNTISCFVKYMRCSLKKKTMRKCVPHVITSIFKKKGPIAYTDIGSKLFNSLNSFINKPVSASLSTSV